jgi:DNA polymerase I-like protein with 3'-5' exonuclease and polymerase domains
MVQELQKAREKRAEERTETAERILDSIIELRRIKTLISSFIDVKIDADERLRTSFSFIETGRLSSHEDELGEGTHLQNVPPQVRKMFVADPGMMLVEADKKQGEAMIVAWLAGEERQKEVFRSGGDIHEFNAKNLGTDRQFAKTRTHGWNYGLGRHKKKVMTHEDKAREKYFQAYPRIERWQKEVIGEVAKYRRLVNPFGRRRLFFGRVEWELDEFKHPIRPKFNETMTEAIAYLPQSTLVDDVNRGLIEFFYRGEPHLQILHQGHDSVLWQTKKDFVRWSVKLAKECFERKFVCGGDVLVIPIEIKVGNNWKEMEKMTDVSTI